MCFNSIEKVSIIIVLDWLCFEIYHVKRSGDIKNLLV